MFTNNVDVTLLSMLITTRIKLPCMFTNNVDVTLLSMLITTRIIRLENITHNLGFTVYNNHPCPRAPPWSQMLIEHQWDCEIGNYYIALLLQQ